MLHVTHKDCLKLVGVAVITVVLFLGATFSGVVAAVQPLEEPDLSITIDVRKAVSCFAFASSLRLGDDVLNTYLSRIGTASMHAGAVYQLGYTRGLLDAYGYANASKFADNKEARLDAAENLYRMTGCTVNESI